MADISSVTVNGVAYDIKDKNGSVPKGIICMWSGTLATIPSGWKLCDGTNGTPNLLDRFICGVATNTTNPGVIGGSNSMVLTTSNMPAHTHTGPSHSHGIGSHTHIVTGDTGTAGGGNISANVSNGVTAKVQGGTYEAGAQNGTNPFFSKTWENGGTGVVATSNGQLSITGTALSHTHSISLTSAASSGNTEYSGTSATGSTGSGTAFDNRPSYYALAFIMKTI